MEKFEKLLSQKAQSPTPRLQADPFLATKITTLAEGKEVTGTVIQGTSWSFASFVTAVAVFMGVYLGLGIWENSAAMDDSDIVDIFSDAFYQSGFADNLDTSIENGD